MSIKRKRSELNEVAMVPKGPTIENKENQTAEAPTATRRSARLMGNMTAEQSQSGVLPSIQQQKKELEYINYKGAIKYCIIAAHIAEQSDVIMQWVNKQTDPVVPMAFDMEWPFSFQTGSGKSAVIQICVDESCCYVFQLTNLKKLPPALIELLKHPKVRLHGVNIKADFRKLARDFPEVNADTLIEKCVDLGVWYNAINGSGPRWSLERLTNQIAELALDKNKKVRMSKWNVVPLDQNQLIYAAIDVYIGQVIYRKLQHLEETKLKNEEQFKCENGEIAFKAVKTLGETFL